MEVYLGHLGSGGSPLTKTRDTGREIGQGGGRHQQDTCEM